jgi:hypothetical protein
MAERDAVIDPLLLGASEAGHRLFRNNSGIAFHKDGSAVRYGVGLGGSDTIGWTRLVVTPEMVGKTVAVFTAIEAKTGKQKPSKDQETFLKVVHEAGGIALWGNDAREILNRWWNTARIMRHRGEW